MGKQRHSWWQNIQQRPLICAGIVVTIAVLIVFALAIFKFGWDWTGFTGGESNITITSTSKGITTAKELQPAKTFWDWLELLAVLAIPVMVGFGATWFTRIQQLRDQEHERLQRERDQEAARIQHDRDRKLADQRAELEREAAEQRAELERELTRDNQRENALQAYLDKMSELLFEKKLRESTEGDGVRKIARVRTLTVLRGLDAKRKASLLQFLHEAGLIDKDHCIIKLEGADLSGVNLSRVNLREINLRRTNLSGANLSEANLSEADLSEADLSGSDLERADLSGANLLGTRLHRANLYRTDLTQARLSGADLQGSLLIAARLHGADLSKARLGISFSNTRIGVYHDETGADLPHPTILVGADLEEANLNEAKLQSTQLVGTNLSRADLSGADLSDANLSSEMVIHVKGVEAETIETAIGVLYAHEGSGPSGIRITGVGHPLIDQKMNPDELVATFASGANLSGANLSRATLVQANLRGADLSRADLSGADLERANLSSAEIYQDSFGETKFKGTNLEEANLTGAVLIGANLSGANLERTKLEGANLGEADVPIGGIERIPGTNLIGGRWGSIKTNLSGVNVTAEQLEQAKTLKGAIMPDGTEHP